MDLYLYKDGFQHKHHLYTKVGSGDFKEVKINAEDCDCDLYAYIKELKVEYICRRFEGSTRRSLDDMFHNICTQINNNWRMTGNRIISRANDNRSLVTYDGIKELTGPNFRNIAPYFHTNRKLNSSSLHIDMNIAHFYQMYDTYYVSLVLRQPNLCETLKKIWKGIRISGNYLPDKRNVVGRSWDDHKYDTLVEASLSELSIFNQVYGGRGKFSNTVYTMTHLHSKLFTAMEKLVKPTHSMFGNAHIISRYTSAALNLMVKMLDVEQYKCSREWLFERELERSKQMPLGSSSGIRASGLFKGKQGDSRKVRVDGTKYKVTVTGKKANQLEYTAREIVRMGNQVRDGEKIKFYDRAWTNVPKNEVLAGMNRKEIEKFHNKLRLFNIPSCTLARMQNMVHFFRQNVERGNHIAIGCSMWHGGANRIANMLHCFSKDHTYYTGDFSGLDTTLKAHLLLIYSYFSRYYYMKSGDIDIYEAFLKVVADNLTLKIVHVYEDIWKMIYGGMPSGAYETSHGDSWIVMFVYVIYFLYVGTNNPSYMGYIKKSLLNKHIMFFIYGDDVVLSVPNDLTHIINIFSFSKFVREYFQMEMRDLEVITDFFSTPDLSSGYLKTKGAVFLSKYFVRRGAITRRTDIPEVLPYREMSKIIKKFAFGDGSARAPVEYVLAAIGMAYDSYGTNMRAYEFCKFMYDSSMRFLGFDFFSDFYEEYNTLFEGKNITNLIKKLGISKELLSKGFPSIDRILDMHVNDPDKHVGRDVGFDATSAVLAFLK